MALVEIRDSRLYREQHATFEDYWRNRWELTKSHAHRLICAAQVHDNLVPMGTLQPTNERQVRPLTKLETAEAQREAQKKPNSKNSL